METLASNILVCNRSASYKSFCLGSLERFEEIPSEYLSFCFPPIFFRASGTSTLTANVNFQCREKLTVNISVEGFWVSLNSVGVNGKQFC